MCLHIPCCCCCYYLFFLQWDLPLPAAVAPLPLSYSLSLSLIFTALMLGMTLICNTLPRPVRVCMRVCVPAPVLVRLCSCACVGFLFAFNTVLKLNNNVSQKPDQVGDSLLKQNMETKTQELLRLLKFLHVLRFCSFRFCFSK